MNWLLVFVPITIALEYLAPERHLLIFVMSGLAILPLAAWMGRATEQLAERMGEGVGGLLNATFGNAAELIIALAALRQGLYDVVDLDRAARRLCALSRLQPGDAFRAVLRFARPEGRAVFPLADRSGGGRAGGQHGGC